MKIQTLPLRNMLAAIERCDKVYSWNPALCCYLEVKKDELVANLRLTEPEFVSFTISGQRILLEGERA